MLLAIDQGTTSTRAVIFDEHGDVLGKGQVDLPQNYPQPGWVEQNPDDIWQTTVDAVAGALTESGTPADSLRAVGITGQRETTIVWDRRTGEPIHPAIVWQCRRTAQICEKLAAEGLGEEFRARTGLIVDPYFSATKIRWILDNVDGAQRDAEMGHLAFGTVDSWLIWKLTGGAVHATDYTNASRTLLLNIHERDWDNTLLAHLRIPPSIMPQVKFSSVLYGMTACPEVLSKPIAISGVAGDQQAALYGHHAFDEGQAKVTYGTGCFVLQHTGQKPVVSARGLLSTIAIDRHGGPAHALEGAVFNAGSAVQWLRDGLGMIRTAEESEEYAKQVVDTMGVYVVPAFTGMGAPHWNMNMRGSMFGITRGTARHHIVRATLESIAYQAADVLDAVALDSGTKPAELRVDGGASQNDFLMQFQADILGTPIVRPKHLDTTVAGAALLAGMGSGVWNSPGQADMLGARDRVFDPVMGADERERLRAGWSKAVAAAAGF